MTELIVSIIFILSAAVVAGILYRKMPVVATMPKNGGTGIRKHKLVAKIEHYVRQFSIAIEKQVWLHKVLSWVRIMILKVEQQVDRRLQGIRKKAQKVDREQRKK